MQRRRGKRRKYGGRRIKRRIRWLGAWAVVLSTGVLAVWIVALTVSGIRNVCESALAEQTDGEIAFSSDSLPEKSRTEGNGSADKAIPEEKNFPNGEREKSAEPLAAGMNKEEPDPETLLVNKSVYLPTDYEVNLTTLKNGQQVASVMYTDLRNMLEDGKECGLSFLIASGYRSSEKQANLLKEEIDKNQAAGMDEEEARKDALLTVAPAHYSEHETGLAVDIVAVANQRLDETQEQTPENQWLQENCVRYGFILRYPEEKEEVTGFSYESWHFRYVGKTAAKAITDGGMALEEYLEKS